ncbi:hypothetical protein EVAR_54368_1 [Eumeta japonica]|uniref:Uncharacterized protein n=1 Tax=Eumeta variegata TaxID=151549 RepID=A0A4C1Y4Y0_EUMVA|nr:hypothetical protein EVAR_54368_1 [Eumeta japonica]
MTGITRTYWSDLIENWDGDMFTVTANGMTLSYYAMLRYAAVQYTIVRARRVYCILHESTYADKFNLHRFIYNTDVGRAAAPSPQQHRTSRTRFDLGPVLVFHPDLALDSAPHPTFVSDTAWGFNLCRGVTKGGPPPPRHTSLHILKYVLLKSTLHHSHYLNCYRHKRERSQSKPTRKSIRVPDFLESSRTRLAGALQIDAAGGSAVAGATSRPLVGERRLYRFYRLYGFVLMNLKNTDDVIFFKERRLEPDRGRDQSKMYEFIVCPRGRSRGRKL